MLLIPPIADPKPALSLSLDDDIAVPRAEFDLANVTASYPCAYSKLESDVLMMEPAGDWHRCDAANLLDPAKIWSIFVQ